MTVSSLGDWLGVFALTAYVANLSHNKEFAVGGVLLFRVLPAMLFAQVAGVFADRFDRRRLMITADIARAGLIATVPFIHSLWALFGLSALMEILSLMWTPAKDATIPNLVERDELLTANQLALITTYGTFPIAGALLTALALLASAMGVFKGQPTSLAFFFDAGSYLFSATMIAALPVRLMRAKRAPGKFNFAAAFRDLAEGLRFVRSHRMIRTLVGGAWVAFIGGSAVISLGPIFAASTKGGDKTAAAAAWGSLIIAVGTGLVGGMILAGALARRISPQRIFPLGLLASGAGVIITGSMRAFGPAMPAVFFTGLGAGIAWVTIFTMIQERVHDRLRGRTFATLYTGIHMSLFLGLAGWPLLAGLVGNHTFTVGDNTIDLSGFRIMLWLGGVVLGLSGVLAIRSMRILGSGGLLARVRGLEFRQHHPTPVSGGARRGVFITFEGVEGSGKSTQMMMLRDFLSEFGRDVMISREPGGTTISERIRAVVLDPSTKEMDAKAEALLYAASRAQHVAQVIRPALEEGKAVLVDRYIDSSLAYQGLARGLGEDDIYRLNIWATDELIPDLAILLNVDAEVGLSRTKGAPDRIESEDIAFHRKVSEAYLQLARTHPSRFAVIDASQSIEDVRKDIEKAVYNLLHDE